MAKMTKSERKFTENDMDEYKDTFTMFDKVGDNKIQSTQVADICRALGWNPTNAAVKTLIGDKDECFPHDIADRRSYLPRLYLCTNLPSSLARLPAPSLDRSINRLPYL